MSSITTHVLDISLGRPAAGVPVGLEIRAGTEWNSLGRGETDGDGRITTLLAASHKLAPGTYRLTFDTSSYYLRTNKSPVFYPQVQVTFDIADATQHYHIPLLLSPYGYSTYRGS